MEVTLQTKLENMCKTHELTTIRPLFTKTMTVFRLIPALIDIAKGSSGSQN